MSVQIVIEDFDAESTTSDTDSMQQRIPIGCKTVLLFWAPWHEDSVVGGPMDTVLTALATNANTNASTNTNKSINGSAFVRFGRVNAEECESLCSKYNVTAIPTFVFLNADGTLFERITGCDDVAQVTQTFNRLLSLSTVSAEAANDSNTATVTDNESEQSSLKERLSRLTRSSDVMIFIKGTPEQPRCGFSRQLVEILQANNVPFHSFDILIDESVRQGLKQYSNWPTYPQLYVRGELIGGLDIVKELVEEGNLADQWNVTVTSKALSVSGTISIEDRCRQLIQQERVMLFMKGLPSTPRCGFSRRIVEILDGLGISYGSFDILQDEDVRQTLKVFSNWPTYPQLYASGQLIGGLDIVEELFNDGTLQETLQSP